MPHSALTGLLGAVFVLAIAALGYALLTPSAPGGTGGAWPEPEHMDTLSRYLRTVEDAQRRLTAARSGAAFGEPERMRDAFSDWSPPPPAAAPRPPSRGAGAALAAPRQLSAVLLAGDSRIAIIDDVVVRAGDTLGDGARVVAIEANRVVLLETSGTRTVLRM